MNLPADARAEGLGGTIGLVSLITVVGSLPAFLLGALSVFMSEDLSFDEARLGVAVALFYGCAGVASIPGGRFAQRRGAREGMQVAALLSSGAMLCIAVLANSWVALALLLVPAGLAHGIAHPAANLAVAVRVPLHRQGVVHGLKQSAVPVATLLAGGTVPLVALTIGWRYAFVLAALIALGVFTIPQFGTEASLWGKSSRRVRATDMRAGDVPTNIMVIVSVATGCGAAAAISLNAFLVESGVAYGLSPRWAGLLLATGGVTGIVTRITVGWIADRGGGRQSLSVVIGMLGAGAAGYLLLAMAGGSALLMVAGTVLTFSAGWGWTGLLNFAILRRNPNAPAAASGIIQAGAAVGGILGPLVFGVVAGRASFPVAWMVAGGLAALASVLFAWAGRLMEPNHERMPGIAADSGVADRPG